jgi:hypothetical protein
VWAERPIERITYENLIHDLGESAAKERFGFYTTSRNSVVWHILPQIVSVLPDHTDHGPDHVAHVLDNAGLLLDIENQRHSLTGMEMYSLIMAVLFHDVGNIYGREDHQRKIAQIYDFCRAVPQRDFGEKMMLMKATEAHCGKASDGSNDTLKELTDKIIVCGQPVHLRTIAAILRFADELAEGPRRTSLFMQMHHRYRRSSRIFHSYADSISVGIDPGNYRIALTYHINVKINRNGELSNEETNRIEKLIEYIYRRINKLDQERKYAKHYCDLLNQFKSITITFNFWIRDQIHGLGLPSQYALTDLVIPGEHEKQLYEYDNAYRVDNIISKIKSVVDGAAI